MAQAMGASVSGETPAAVAAADSAAQVDKLYALLLEDGKYYIGRSSNVFARFETHKSGKGPSWTQKYKPLGIAEVRTCAASTDEDSLTKEYMIKHGVENVRGGSYTAVVLDDASLDVLVREIRTAQQLCMRCGRDNHFASKCYVSTEVDHITRGLHKPSDPPKSSPSGPRTAAKREPATAPSSSPKPAKKRATAVTSDSKVGVCSRCGRDGHTAASCYAKSHVDGTSLGRPSQRTK